MPNTGQGSMTTSECQRARSERATGVLFSVTTGGNELTSYGLSSFSKLTPLPFLIETLKLLAFPLTPKVDWTGPGCFLEGTRESAVVKVATALRDIGNRPISLQ